MMTMMKVSQSIKSILRRDQCGISRVFRVLFYSTDIVASSSSKDTLYRRLTPFGNPPPGFLIQSVLDQWAGEGRAVEREELRITIKQLRKFKRFKEALQVSEWMTEKIYLDLSPGEAAGRLDLISKVHGLEQAEKYLSNIPIALVGVPVYGALLNCFAHARNLEKTEAIMQKMRELGFAKRVLPYNVMLKLYSDMGNHEKLDSLMQEMEEKGINWDKFTYNTRLNAYANASDLGGMEKLLMKMEADPEVTMDWKAYVVVANVMLKLYSDMGNHEKLDSLMQEMEEKGINWDKFTYNTRLNAYANASDLGGMEKLLMKMEADPEVTMDWKAYVVVANGYLRAGAVEKASSMLKKSEHLVRVKVKRIAYEVLLTMYASIGKKNEVYRIWGLFKNSGRIYNMSYLCMMRSLVMLDDLDGAEKIWEEWEAVKECFDSRIPSLIVSAYCKRGLLGNAESIVNRLIESGVDPSTDVWQPLATGYHEYDLSEKAVETMRKAILASYPGWKPNLATLAACLEYLKGKGRIEVAAELIELLKVKGCMPTEVYDRVVKYMESGNLESESLDPMGGSKKVLEGEETGKELKC